MHVAVMHGVRSSLALEETHDLAKALAVRNPELSPHLSFMDVSGHGYARVRVRPDDLEVEFVGIERPIEASPAPDGGPPAYRVGHRVRWWGPGEAPRTERIAVEGTLPLVL